MERLKYKEWQLHELSKELISLSGYEKPSGSITIHIKSILRKQKNTRTLIET